MTQDMVVIASVTFINGIIYAIVRYLLRRKDSAAGSREG